MENSIREDIENAKTFKIEINNEEAKEILKSVLNRIEIKGAKLYVVKQAIKQVLKENEELLELKVSAGAHNRILELEKENKNLKATNKDLQKSVDMIYADYQDIGNKAFEYSDKIEQLQKENEDLKAKLEYKQYGDLDNTEFEKYINDIVETRTKELKEQLEEEQELNKIIKETRINKVLENNIEVKKLREENEELKADNYEANNIIKDLLDSIPKQKVKDMIEELKQKQTDYGSFRNFDIESRISILEELLENEGRI